jgi:7,8-dihydropterin-6-yl-methyl-4-(beta-D-ribofuranosyl)aminobenzene 5'-phosphate synthase
MKARITIVCENTVSSKGGIGEHGFAAYLETERGNYLWDTGRGDCLIPNLLTLDKDPLSIQKILLSHGHYDQTGGLPAILELLGETEIIAHPDIFGARYRISKDSGKEIRRFVGIKHRRAYLEGLGARFSLGKDFREISKEFFITGEIPRKNSFEKGDARLFAEVGGQLVPDPFADDQSLILMSSKGLVFLLGCAHAGMVNILEYGVEKTGHDRIYAVMGGTHLDFASPLQTEETIKTLKKFKIEKIGVSHCTGWKAALRLYTEFGDRFFFGQVGEVLEV